MPVKIKANVVLMCSCNVIKGNSIWKSDIYEINALVYHIKEKVDEIPMKFVKTNTIEATYQPKGKNVYEVIIHAYDPKSRSIGDDKPIFILQ